MTDKPLMKRVTITLTQEQLRLIRSTNIGANDAEAIRGLAMAWLAEKSMLSTTAKNRMAAPAEVVSSKITKSPHEGEQHDLKVTCPFCGNIEIQHGIAGSLSMAEIMNDTEKCTKCGREFKLQLVASTGENDNLTATANYYTLNPISEEDNPEESTIGIEEHHCPVCGQRHVYLTSREMAAQKERTQKENCHACHAQYYHKVDYRKPAGEIKQSQMKKFYEKQ